MDDLGPDHVSQPRNHDVRLILQGECKDVSILHCLSMVVLSVSEKSETWIKRLLHSRSRSGMVCMRSGPMNTFAGPDRASVARQMLGAGSHLENRIPYFWSA
jgi:hypothetical protein